MLLAEQQHLGQTDKSGKPYILHPKRVARRMKTPEEKVVGWLHEVIEDTGLSLSEIGKQFGSETADAVNAISRRDRRLRRSIYPLSKDENGKQKERI